MKYRWAWLLSSAVGPVFACSTGDVTRVGDQPDDNALTPLARAGQALTIPCRYDADPDSRRLSLELVQGEAVVLSNVDGFVLVNDAQCSTPVPAAEVLRVSITGSAGDESVTLDFSGGPFAFPAAATAGLGVEVDLGGGDDALEIVLGPSDERVSLGAGGLSIVTPEAPQSDAFKDITPSHVERLTLRLGDGNDTYAGGGSPSPDLGGPFVPSVSLVIDGGGGDDTFIQSPLETPAETISGGDGRDVVSYSARLAAVSVTLSAAPTGAATGLTGPAGLDAGAPEPRDAASDDLASDDDFDAGAQRRADAGDAQDAGARRAIAGDDGAPGEGDDLRDDIEIVIGGSGDDVLSGGANADMLLGGNGDDTLAGGLGDDSLIGGNGLDWFAEGSAPNGADLFTGGAGLDIIDYGARLAPIAVSLDGSANDGAAGEGDNVSTDIEHVTAGAGDDVLSGNASNNVFIGGPGDDVVSGGDGYDTLSYANAPSAVRAALPDPSLGTPSTGNGTAGESDSIDASIENLTGSAHDDVLTGNRGANELSGGAGNDTLIGGAGDDVLEGGAPGNTESNHLDCGSGDDLAYSAGAPPGATTLDCEL